MFANTEEPPVIPAHPETPSASKSLKQRLLSGYLLVAIVAAAVYLGCIISPPSLMDDVDAVEAQIARNMITSGDWVTQRVDGVPFLEKGPLVYWCIAASFKLFGVHDWVARIPLALTAISLALLTTAFGVWAFGRRVGIYAGICISTCVGLFLFTRVQIPDVILTFTIACSMWAFLRVLDEDETRPRLWAFVLAANLGVGLLLKSLIGVVFPVAAGLIYLALTRQLFLSAIWKRLRPFSGTLIILLIAAPWHILATLRNPPYFVFTMRSVPGEYHGFFWFYFINEQLLRFLNIRYPRDYDTVPRLYFWLFHLIWLFPWSVYLPGVAKLSYKPVDREGRTRLLALCWIGVVMVFFTFSTTQEYYSMPIYPALALLLGCAMATGNRWVRAGTRTLSIITGCAALCGLAILFYVRGIATPGDISAALSPHPNAYKLALGHMEDLTLQSFAYLRLPLALATVAFLIGCIGNWRTRAKQAFVATALMMVLFFQAARLALVVFDPYMSSRPLAEALLKSPPGELIINHHYFEFSSVFFYTNRTALLLNGRFHNLVYGSYAPGAAQVFINDSDFQSLWQKGGRYYLVTDQERLAHIQQLVSRNDLINVAESGGKFLLTNHPLVNNASQ